MQYFLKLNFRLQLTISWFKKYTKQNSNPVGIWKKSSIVRRTRRQTNYTKSIKSKELKIVFHSLENWILIFYPTYFKQVFVKALWFRRNILFLNRSYKVLLKWGKR